MNARPHVLAALLLAVGCSKPGGSGPPEKKPAAPAPSASAAAQNLPKNACPTLGGLFGDWLEEGDYRCAGDVPPLHQVEVCHAGKWEAAATCTCDVISSVTQLSHPSQCFDVEVKGEARCGFSIDSCLLCTPGRPCRAE